MRRGKGCNKRVAYCLLVESPFALSLTHIHTHPHTLRHVIHYNIEDVPDAQPKPSRAVQRRQQQQQQGRMPLKAPLPSEQEQDGEGEEEE